MKVGDKFKDYSDNTWVKIDKAFIGKIGIVESIDYTDNIMIVEFTDPYFHIEYLPLDFPYTKISFKNKLK